MSKQNKTYLIITEKNEWKKYIKDALNKLKVSYEYKEENRFCEFDIDNKKIVFGSRCFSPGVAIDLEIMNMNFKSIKKAFRVATCGGYNPALKVGDIVMGTDAIRSEGTTRNYFPDIGHPAVCDVLLANEIWEIMKKELKRTYMGTIWTTDGRFAGQYDPNHIENMINNKVYAVDMETAAFLVVTKYLGFPSASLSVVIDLPKEDKEFKPIDLTQKSISDSLAKCFKIHLKYIINDK